MNILTLLQQSKIKRVAQVGSALATLCATGLSYAGASTFTLSTLNGNVGTAANGILKIVMTVITIAGVILVIMGIVHLKQNYTGTGQEKHLSKGLACLGFGAALFIAVPITHALVAGVGGEAYSSSWSSVSTAGSLGSDS